MGVATERVGKEEDILWRRRSLDGLVWGRILSRVRPFIPTAEGKWIVKHTYSLAIWHPIVGPGKFIPGDRFTFSFLWSWVVRAVFQGESFTKYEYN